MDIAIASHTDRQAWDLFVRSHRRARPYHLFAWKEAVKRAYGHEAAYLLAREDGVVVGVLPLVVMKFLGFHRRIVSLPYCDVGAALTIGDRVDEGLYQEALRHAVRLGVGVIEIRAMGEASRPAAAPAQVAASGKVSMLLALPGDSEALWGGFKSKLRSQIRKAEKNNLAFRWGDHADRRDFYHVFCRAMQELGSPVHSRRWIDAVLDSFGGGARMGLVFLQGTPVGAGVILEVGDIVCVPWAVTLNMYNHLSPNMLLYWNFLKYACDSGHAWFDFGRSSPGGGTFRFKAQWGAEPSGLSWYSLRPGRRIAAAKHGIGGVPGRGGLASLWSALPQGLADRLGPRLRRHISL